MMPYLIEIFTVPVVVVHSSLDNRVVFKYFWLFRSLSTGQGGRRIERCSQTYENWSF